MYKSREDEYQNRFEDTPSQPSYGYNNTRTPYQNDVYEEDDFYGQIMRNASRNNPYREAPQEQPNYRSTPYENEYQETPRRSRMDMTGRLPQIEEDSYSRNIYQEKSNTYPTSSQTYANPSYSANEYTPPVRAHERTSQFSTGQFQAANNEYLNNTNYQNNNSRETLSRRSRVQEESYVPREPQIQTYQNEDVPTPSFQRRTRPIEEPVQSYGSFQETIIEEPKKAPMTLSEEYESNRKSKKPKTKAVKKEKKQVAEKIAVDANTHKKFVKSNLLIFVIALVNMAAVSLITASVLYTQFLKNYIVQANMVEDIIKLCLLLTPLFAYQLAGLHCGYSMLKDKFKNLKPGIRIILSPILFIVYELTGFVCEIPYLIYSMIKMNEDN